MKSEIFTIPKERLSVTLATMAAVVIILASVFTACRGDKAETSGSAKAIPSMLIASDLSNQRVTAFAEDSVGRIWIGTFRGLNRYNAYDYHQYFCTDDSIDLPDNQINHLYYDSSHRLWVATINGLAVFDRCNHFRPVRLDGGFNAGASQILESDDHRVLANFNTFLAQYDPDDDVLKSLAVDINPNHDFMVSCGFDRRNRLWVASSTALRCYQGEDYSLADSLTLPGYASAVYFDHDNDRIWLGGHRWIGVYDTRNKHFEPVSGQLAEHPAMRDVYITNIHPYEGGYWLINTSNHGVLVYNANTDRLWRQDDPGFPFDMPPYRVDRFFTDSHKNLWVGSYNNGATVINQYKRPFNSNSALQSLVNGIPVSSVDNDDAGNLWCAAGHEGLIRYNTRTGQSNTVEARALSGDDSPMASVTLVKGASDGTLWVGSLMEHKLWHCRPTPTGVSVIKQYDMPTPLAITEDTQGNIWIGTGGPWLLRHNKDTDTFDHWEMPDPAISCFVSGVEIADDRLYVTALMRPLMQIPLTGADAQIDTLHIDGWEGMIKRSVFIPTDLLYDSYGLLWIGTVGNGLLCYNPADGIIESVPGMPCTDISSIAEDRQGHIWVSTQYGIARLDRTSRSVKCYYGVDGLGGNQFYDRANTTLPDGTIVFGATHGLTVFNPLDVDHKRRVPLVFEDLKIHNRIVDPHTEPEVISASLSEGPQVNIDHDQNAFSISFAALDYPSQEPTGYSYMLEGHDPDWIYTRETNEAYYARVAPGSYTFRVRIGDGSESLADQEISLRVKVKGNPWRSWWAVCIYIAVALTVIGVIWHHKKRIADQRLRIDQILASIEMVRQQAATMAANPDDTTAPETQPLEERMSEADSRFMQELQALMEAELGNSELDINHMAKMMRISRTKLYYKIKTLAGTSPATFFKTYKLNRAAQLLCEGDHTMGEIAELTGYSTLAHFSTSFKKHFGMPPSEFAHHASNAK